MSRSTTGREAPKQLLVEIPESLFAELKEACEAIHSTKGGLVRRAIEVYLAHLHESSKTFVVELSEPAAEKLAVYREAADLPDRGRLTESALGLYVDTRLDENNSLRERFEEARKARSKSRVTLLKEARKE